MITIRQPLSFSEIGMKDNQEDYLYPSDADTSTRLFILCDGMGGHDNGEVASRTAAEALGGYLSEYRRVTEERFQQGLAVAYDALDAIDTGSAKKPGTTMTCLALNDNSFLVAHIGDSRVYQIRPSLYNPKTRSGGIVLKTEDHSLVNDLLRAGELTQEEAENFPNKNIITRAMQPHLDKRYRADVFVGESICSGDYFFLCCDGILEQLSEERLCQILADTDLDDSAKLAAIKKECYGKTRDNFTCWLIPIDKVEITKRDATTEVITAIDEDEERGLQGDKENEGITEEHSDRVIPSQPNGGNNSPQGPITPEKTSGQNPPPPSPTDGKSSRIGKFFRGVSFAKHSNGRIILISDLIFLLVCIVLTILYFLFGKALLEKMETQKIEETKVEAPANITPNQEAAPNLYMGFPEESSPNEEDSNSNKFTKDDNDLKKGDPEAMEDGSDQKPKKGNTNSAAEKKPEGKAGKGATTSLIDQFSPNNKDKATNKEKGPNNKEKAPSKGGASNAEKATNK